MVDLAVIILTYNEELHIERALKSINGLAREVFVIDSFSTDRTVEIARAYGATVLQNPFVNQSKQFRWGMNNAPITSGWVMRLDADEIIEADLKAEIETKLSELPADIVGINLKRKHVFLDRWIKHGGRYPLLLLRIWRRGMATIEDRWMDEHIIVSGGRTVTFDGGFADYNLNNLSYFIDKHNKYATREAVDVLSQNLNFHHQVQELSRSSTSNQAALKRLAKEKFYNRMPFQISALAYFFYRYFLLLGFLDGKEGLIYHALQGLWYRFLVGAKVYELHEAVSHLRDPDEIKLELSRLTGLKLS